jgi:hypothetical protein
MSTGGHAHELFLSGNNTGTTISLLPGQGTVFYNGTSDQNVLGTTYGNLILTGGSVKTMQNAIGTENMTITGGATLLTNQYQIGGGTTLSITDGSTLALGSTINTTNVTFPGYSSVFLSPNSTVRYQSLGNQTVDGNSPNYGNLVIAGGGVKNSIGDFQVFGNLIIDAGATYAPPSGSNTLLYGSIVNNGTLQAAPGNKIVFLGPNIQSISGVGQTNFSNLANSKTSGFVSLHKDLTINHGIEFNGSGILQLNSANVTLSGVATISGISPQGTFGFGGTYTSGSVFLNGSTSGQYLNKIIPISGPNGFAPVTIAGLNGSSFGVNSTLELKYISTVTGNSSDLSLPSLYARTHNITDPSNFKFLMPSTQRSGFPKSVYVYSPSRTTLSGSFFDQVNEVFGVGGNNIGINGTYVLEGEYYEPSLYRTVSNGSWSNINIWERFNGMSWIPATTLPGMAVAGDQVLVNTNLDLDLSPSFSLQSLTIAGGASALVFGNTKRVLTITGDFRSTGGALDMRDANHELYLGGGLTTFVGTGDLLTNDAGSSIIYCSSSSSQLVFKSNNY